MNWKHSFLPILLVVLVIGWFVAQTGQGTTTGKWTAATLDQLTPQPSHERVWQPRPSTQELTLESSDEAALFGSLRLKVDPQGTMYVLDYGDFMIKQFTPQGRYVRSYGMGKGQGPGEFATPTDFAVTADDRLWVVDADNGRLTSFTSEGQPDRTLKLQREPYRLSLSTEDRLFVMYGVNSPEMFALFDSGEEPSRTFGALLENQLRHGLLLDGWIEALPDGGFVYSGLYCGMLLAYNNDGTPRFLTETINRPPLPKIVRNSQGRSWVDREAFHTTLTLSVSDRGIHVFTYYEAGLKKLGVIDTYSLQDGTYLYSREIPEAGRKVVVTADHLYMVQDTQIHRWRLDFVDS